MAVNATGLRSKVRRQGTDVAAGAADRMLDDVIDDIPVDEGFMRNNTRVRRRSPLSWTIFSAAQYASFTDTGSRPHVITPKSPGGVLVFQSGGQTIFAKKVNHPGTSGTRWWSDTVTRRGWIQHCRAALRTSRVR